MRLVTIIGPLRLTRIELPHLLDGITSALAELPEGSDEREIALTNIRNNRYSRRETI